MKFFIDYENVHAQGFRGAEFLLPEDEVAVFYSKNSQTMERGILKTLYDSGCSCSIFRLENAGRNALDFYITSYIGETLGHGYCWAIGIYGMIPGYRDADEKKNVALYNYADVLITKKKYRDAYNLFVSLGEYSDAASRAEALKSKLIKAGSIVLFGHYEQDNNVGNGPEQIEWIVLEYDENSEKALLLSRYGLDVKPYNQKLVPVTWEECTIRSWLNGIFLQSAFSPEEQTAIQLTDVDNSLSQGYWKTNGGKNTQDYIFLLSYAEANRYLGVTSGDKNNMISRTAPTVYALSRGAWTDTNTKTEDGAAATQWWLRSPGRNQRNVAFVIRDGSLDDSSISRVDRVIRPSFWINVKSVDY